MSFDLSQPIESTNILSTRVALLWAEKTIWPPSDVGVLLCSRSNELRG
jgi:hypothetical protein